MPVSYHESKKSATKSASSLQTAPTAQDLMQRMVKLLHERMLKYNWVGFYMLEPGAKPPMLVLGAFEGAMTPHTRIPLQSRHLRSGCFERANGRSRRCQQRSPLSGVFAGDKIGDRRPDICAREGGGRAGHRQPLPCRLHWRTSGSGPALRQVVGKKLEASVHNESRTRQSARAGDRAGVAEFHSAQLPAVARTRGAGRLLGLHLRQLHSHPALCAGLARALSRQGTHRHRSAHAGVYLRAV